MAKTVFKTTSSKSKPKATDFVIGVKKGNLVFQEGDLGTEMYIIQDGQIEILKHHKEEERQLAILGQGDFFGEMSILEDLPRTASARALVDCRLLQINSATFDQMLRKNPEIAVRMMRKLSRRLRETDAMLRDVLGAEESQAPEMPTPDAPKAEPASEKLIHTSSGMDLFLSRGEETLVGRRDPVTGIHPDIDLSPLDTQRSISRRHATLFRKGSKFFVREEVGTMNGTFVNGERIETGVPVEFKDGDTVRFGLVETTFHAG